MLKNAAGSRPIMPAKRIITIGPAALDFVYRIDAFPARPTKLRAREHITSGGGMAANAAAAAARLGGDVSLWSRIGSDAAGRLILHECERFGVDTRHVKVHEGARSATAAVIVDAAGERFIVSEDDHAMPMTADWLPLEEIQDAGVVLSDLSWLEGTRAAFETARAAGVPTVVDVDLGSGGLLADLLPLTDYVIASAPAFERFVAGAGADQRLASLLAAGARHAGVTRGAEGYTWMTEAQGVVRQPAFPVAAIDTTGAGDAFHGAFAWALAEGHPDTACATLASAAAALKCRRLGARQGLPTLSELEDFLADRVAVPPALSARA
jgi:sulfofructose kinase